MRGAESFPAMGTWIEIWNHTIKAIFRRSRSLQWERGLKCIVPARWILLVFVVPCNGNVDWNRKGSEGKLWWCSRSLQWERGLKSPISYTPSPPLIVVPCNGNVDWNVYCIYILLLCSCRSLQWERGLKWSQTIQLHLAWNRRSLQWERGLK